MGSARNVASDPNTALPRSPAIYPSTGVKMSADMRRAKATVVELNKLQDIYMVVDEHDRPAGTGTREVCEFLADLITKPLTLLHEQQRPYPRSLQIGRA